MGSSRILRAKVAREAAALLYSGVEKEYRQAKLKAAKALGSHFLPTNLQVALELDGLAEENEGRHRQEKLVAMRRQALVLMKILRAFCPVLVGSVWRGTIHRNSDIDVAVYCDDPTEVLETLERHGVAVLGKEWVEVTKQGRREDSFHLHVRLVGDYEAEIVVRRSEEKSRRRTCAIYGDAVVGLVVEELDKILEESPTQRFVPRSRSARSTSRLGVERFLQ